MIKSILLAATLLTTPAIAQETTPPKLVLNCKPFAEIKKHFPEATITKMTQGQFHFLAGFYVGNIATPQGLPPGDGAVVVSQGNATLILWTRGPLACNPIQVSPKLLVLMAQLKVGGDDADTL